MVADLLNGEERVETVLFVAHGGLILALTAKLLRLPIGLWPSLGGISNCHWVDLTRQDGTWRLRAYNAGIIG